MHLNTSTDYAIRMILYLAKAKRIVSSAKLAEALNLSPRYLLQIGARLRNAGLVETTYGSVGGFMLVKIPSEINLYDIVASMEKTINSNELGEVKIAEFRIVDIAYKYVGGILESVLRSITVESLLTNNIQTWYLASYFVSLESQTRE